MLKDEVLEIFINNKNEIITGGYISKKLNVTRAAIWKVINQLKSQGYEIESIKNVGYKYNSQKDIISQIGIRKNLKTKVLGSEIKIFETIKSTNSYAKENNCKNGEVIVALYQSQGRGRKGREFVSNKDDGIYLTFVLNSGLDFELGIDKISMITINVAVAVTRALKKVCNIDVGVKWVNDIFFNNKKLCGILTEATFSLEDQKVDKLIVGIGINTGEVSEDIKNIATSINEISKCKNYKNDLISEILNSFEEIFLNNLNLLEEYKKKLFFMNQKVRVIGQSTYEAIAVDLNERGELIVRDENNNLITLNSGEISIKVGGINEN